MSTRIQGLDGVRAMAVLAVMFSHLGLYMSLSPEAAGRLIPVIGGSAGVTFFFVLSGYLITTLLLREKEKTGTVMIRKFMARRLLRLMPALALFIATVGLLMHLELIAKTWQGLFMAAMYLYNFVGYGENYTGELAHTWSLAIEEHFYLMWPWLLLLANGRRALAIALGLFVFSVLVRMGMGNMAAATQARWTIPGIAPILAGSIAALANYAGQTRNPATAKSRWTEWLGSLGIALWLLPLAVPAAAFKFIWPLQLSGIALLILWITRHQASLVVQALSSKPLAYLGTISYGLYLWQGLFITNGPGGNKLWIQQFPQNIALTLLVAMASYHSIEAIALRYKKKYTVTE